MRLTTGMETKGNPVNDGEPFWTAAAIGAVISGLLLVFVLDQSTGSAPVQHLYYVPIIYAAIRFGIPGGIATSCTAIVLYHTANPRLLAFGYQHWDLMQVALFMAVGVITARLTNDKRRLHLLATTDDLTGLHNLRSFESRLADVVRTCRLDDAPVAILVLDVDRLKSLNDSYGHLAGAEAVRTIGRIIGERLPASAVACRYGGDEFVVAVPYCTEAGGRAVANDLRHAVQTTTPVLAGLPFPARTLSISVGVASRTFEARTSRGDADLGEELFRAADSALYQAKELGRNHVCVA
jgi:diguanylate cyclase (GGDEF)-like protein